MPGTPPSLMPDEADKAATIAAAAAAQQAVVAAAEAAALAVRRAANEAAAAVHMAAAEAEHVAVSLRDMVLDHDRKLDTLLDWRAELRGAMAIVKIAFGTSVLSAIVSMIALVRLLSSP